MSGREGLASDSQILDNPLSRKDNLVVPQGKFYLTDVGYMLRAFGIMKNRFSIIIEIASYDVDTMSGIFIACSILDNFLINFDPDEEFITQIKRDINSVSEQNSINIEIVRGEDERMREILRDSIAA
ncbi:hypothetical protein HN51_046670 [Arachis hypogaea]